MSEKLKASLAGIVGSAAATILITAAKSLFDRANQKKLLKEGEAVYDAVATPTSLTQRAKECFIESRAYLGKDIQHEKVIPGILKLSLTLNSSLVVAGLRLDGLVESGVTVSNRLRTVATEDYLDTSMSLRNDAISLESVDPNVHRERTADERKAEREEIAIATAREKLKQLEAEGKEREAQRLRDEIAREEEEHAKLIRRIEDLGKVETSDVTPSTDANLAVGKVIEVTLSGDSAGITKPGEPSPKVTIPLFIRINPYLVDPELASYMMEATGHGILSGKRRAQLKAGEISFWKDYIFGMDIVRRTDAILKKDNDGEFADYLKSVVRKQTSQWVDAHQKLNDKAYRSSSNLANAILIFSADSVEKGRINNGIDLSKYNERQRFFGATYASMIYVIDPNHERVTLYLNGFRDVGSYSYNDFIHKKDLQGDDFMSILRSVTQGQISRF